MGKVLLFVLDCLKLCNINIIIIITFMEYGVRESSQTTKTLRVRRGGYCRGRWLRRRLDCFESGKAASICDSMYHRVSHIIQIQKLGSGSGSRRVWIAHSDHSRV